MPANKKTLVAGDVPLPGHCILKYLNHSVTLLLSAFLALSLDAVELSIATPYPVQAEQTKQLSKAGKALSTATEGRVTLKLHPGGVMGTDSQVLEKITAGTLQGGLVMGGSISGKSADGLIYSAPFRMLSFEEVDYVRKEMDPSLIQGLKDSGLEILGVAEGGLSYILTKSPIHTIEELRAAKLWTPDNDRAIATMKALGMENIVALKLGDLRKKGIDTGKVDAIAMPPFSAILQRCYGEFDYVLSAPLNYVYSVLVVDGGTFEALSEEDRVIVKQIMGDALAEISTASRQANVEALAIFSLKGIEVVALSPAALKDIESASHEAAAALVAEGILSAESVSTLSELLAEFRKSNSP